MPSAEFLAHLDDLTRVVRALALAVPGKPSSAADDLMRMTDDRLVPATIADLAEQISLIVVQKEVREYRLELMLQDLLQAHAELHEAMHDPLTGLPNRRLFHERLEDLCAMAREQSYEVGLLFIDLDKFKAVNDTLGHDAGDELLIQVTERLRDAVRPEDLVARLGGDEFTAILPDVGRAEAEAVATAIIDTVRRPFTLAGGTAQIGASIGISFFPSEAATPIALIKNADIAVYQAKEGGRNTYRLYHDA